MIRMPCPVCRAPFEKVVKITTTTPKRTIEAFECPHCQARLEIRCDVAHNDGRITERTDGS